MSWAKWRCGRGLFCSHRCAAIHNARNLRAKPNLATRRSWPHEDIKLANGSNILWSQAVYKQRVCRVPVVCSCGKTRLLVAGRIYHQKFTGLCQQCSRIHNGTFGETHSSWKGGHFINSGGYSCFNIHKLAGRAREVAEQMAREIHGKPAVIAEHRLVVALHLNRPLLPSEIIHHKDGNKLNNDLSNLEITSHAGHRQLDVKYYDLWRKALARISELEIELSKSKD